MKYLYLQDHFSSIEPFEPDTQVCLIELSKKSIKVWTVNSLGRWVDQQLFVNIVDFEQACGNLKQWKNILLVNGESLALFYKDAHNFCEVAYVVTLKQTFYNYKGRKPTLFTEYYIKDKFSELRTKLPELKDIF